MAAPFTRQDRTPSSPHTHAPSTWAPPVHHLPAIKQCQGSHASPTPRPPPYPPLSTSTSRRAPSVVETWWRVSRPRDLSWRSRPSVQDHKPDMQAPKASLCARLPPGGRIVRSDWALRSVTTTSPPAGGKLPRDYRLDYSQAPGHVTGCHCQVIETGSQSISCPRYRRMCKTDSIVSE